MFWFILILIFGVPMIYAAITMFNGDKDKTINSEREKAFIDLKRKSDEWKNTERIEYTTNGFDKIVSKELPELKIKQSSLEYIQVLNSEDFMYYFHGDKLILKSMGIRNKNFIKIIDTKEVKQMGLSYSYIPIEETERVVLKEKEKDASVVGRAVVGGLLLGGAGAVVGGMTGMNKNLNNQEQVQLIQKQSKLCDPVIRFTVIYKDKNKEPFEYEYKLRNILITDLGKIDKYNQVFDLS